MMGDSILKETLREEIATEEFVELAVQLLAPAAIAFECVEESGRPE